jgi:predicted transcriptional regulator
MSTTTIRLEEELKARMSAAAERAGKSAHAFILDAIADAVAQAEFDTELDQICEARWAEFLKTGEVVDWEQAKAYLKAPRGQGTRPTPRKL